MARLGITGLEKRAMEATHRSILTVFSLASVVALAAVAGCSTSSVGDPCTPEQVPAGGFDPSETFLETGSVQCATRVCLVDNLAGDPNDVCGQPGASENCVQPSEIEDKVFCSCRCSAPSGSSVPTCGCPSGFLCEDILETGGEGLRGGYCVRDATQP